MRPASDGPRQPRSLRASRRAQAQDTCNSALSTVEFGIGDDALWIEFSESPETFRELSWLEIRNPHLDYLTVFFETNNGEVKQLGQVQGDDLPFTQRSILLRHFVFHFPQLNTT